MFCVVAIFKNESEVLDEWIQHYLHEGCAHFFLIDNNSTDSYAGILEKYDNITLVHDSTLHSQAKLYTKHFASKIHEYTWTVICDLDEFIYARKQDSTIASYLENVADSVSQIAIPWKIFGSNGYNTIGKKEPRSVIQGFTKRINYDKEGGFQGVRNIENGYKMNLCKCIVRSSSLAEMDIHRSKVNQGCTIQSNGSAVKNDVFVPMNESVLNDSSLHLNHYAIRSMDWYCRVKVTRGSAASQTSANIKSKLSYFHEFDKVSNDIDDFELCNKLYTQ